MVSVELPLARIWNKKVGIKVYEVEELMPSMSTMADVKSEKIFTMSFLVHKKQELITKCADVADKLGITNFKE